MKKWLSILVALLCLTGCAPGEDPTGSTPAVTCELYPGETMITQSGAMAWMSPNMDMQTSAGGFGKAFGRLFSGESLFLNT